MVDVHDPPPVERLPERALFEGLLEGPVVDRAALESAVAHLVGVAPFGCSLSVEAGRFSVLVVDGEVDGSEIGADARTAVMAGFRDVVAASEAARVESTLRCTLLYEEEVVEILFAVRAGRLTDAARKRARGPEDGRLASSDVAFHRVEEAESSSRLGRAQRASMALLGVSALAVVAWQAGVLEGFLATPAAELELDSGRFENTLTLEVARPGLGYELSVSRGSAFPATESELAALLSQKPLLADRLALEAVGAGDRVWARLVDAEDHTLATAALDLRLLVLDPDAVAQLDLPAKREAVGIRLGLLPGTKP